ncbi:MAG: hypothetical protein ACPKPY_03520 [Nitrososphaeraceae archaeon]
MSMKLTTTIAKIDTIDNSENVKIIKEFLEYMKNNDSSDNHQNNNLKAVIAFAKFLDKGISFFDIKNKELILSFLNTKKKSNEEDPDKRWITTWKNYLDRIRLFYRWLYYKDKDIERESWIIPEFLKIKNKKSKRIDFRK